MYSIASLDSQQYKIKMTCRYPSVVGQMLKYILIPIKDDDDVDIMFDDIARHPKLSNIGLYLEAKLFQMIVDVLEINVTLILKDLVIKSKGTIHI